MADRAAGTGAQDRGLRPVTRARPAFVDRHCHQGTPRVRHAPSAQESIRSAPAVMTRQPTPSRCWRHTTTGDYLPGSPQLSEFATNIGSAEEPILVAIHKIEPALLRA